MYDMSFSNRIDKKIQNLIDKYRKKIKGVAKEKEKELIIEFDDKLREIIKSMGK